MMKTPRTSKRGTKSIQLAESKLAVLPPSQAQALFSATMMEEAASVLFKNLKATKRMWSQAARDFVEVPDGATQVEAAKCLLSYGVGQPVQRLISFTKTDSDSPEEFQMKLKRSPALRKAIQDMLGDASV
jgi:hypothetical protein